MGSINGNAGRIGFGRRFLDRIALDGRRALRLPVAGRALGALEERQMRHEQAAEFAAHLLRRFARALMLAAHLGNRVVVTGDLAFAGEARLLANEVRLFVRGRLDFVRGPLREYEGILQRFLHRLEVTDAFLEVRDLRLERRPLLCLVLERLDDLVEKLVDVRAVVTLEGLLEGLVLNVDRCNLFHRSRPTFYLS